MEGGREEGERTEAAACLFLASTTPPFVQAHEIEAKDLRRHSDLNYDSFKYEPLYCHH